MNEEKDLTEFKKVESIPDGCSVGKHSISEHSVSDFFFENGIIYIEWTWSLCDEEIGTGLDGIDLTPATPSIGANGPGATPQERLREAALNPSTPNDDFWGDV